MTPEEKLLKERITWLEDGCTFKHDPEHPYLTDLWFAKDTWSPELREWFNLREAVCRDRMGVEPRQL